MLNVVKSQANVMVTIPQLSPDGWDSNPQTVGLSLACPHCGAWTPAFAMTMICPNSEKW